MPEQTKGPRDDLDQYETFHDPDIVCPYCGHKMQNDDYVLSHDDESDYWDCGECEREFHVTLHVDWVYTTKRMEEIKR